MGEDNEADMVEVPPDIRATKFADARLKEIEALQQVLGE